MSGTSSCCKSKMIFSKTCPDTEASVNPITSDEAITHRQTPCKDTSSILACKETDKVCTYNCKDTCKSGCKGTYNDRSPKCHPGSMTPSGCNEAKPSCIVVLKGCVADGGATAAQVVGNEAGDEATGDEATGGVAGNEATGNEATGDEDTGEIAGNETTDDEATGESADENETTCGGKGGCCGGC